MDWLGAINWFAIHSQRFREAVAASSVGALGLEVFLPMVKTDGAQTAAIRIVSKPLFPGYFFARFDPDISLPSVECARGVSYVIQSGTYPIPVDGRAIAEIQDRVEADGLIRLHKAVLEPGTRISIQAGPFEGMMGRVEAECDDRRRVAILLETLWQARVVIEKQWVRAEAT